MDIDKKKRKRPQTLPENTAQYRQKKAITAMARRRVIHLWKMACENKPYIQTALFPANDIGCRTEARQNAAYGAYSP